MLRFQSSNWGFGLLLLQILLTMSQPSWMKTKKSVIRFRWFASFSRVSFSWRVIWSRFFLPHFWHYPLLPAINTGLVHMRLKTRPCTTRNCLCRSNQLLCCCEQKMKGKKFNCFNLHGVVVVDVVVAVATSGRQFANFKTLLLQNSSQNWFTGT